jgi:predicted nucleic-acid-binding Zn-ribbon protein
MSKGEAKKCPKCGGEMEEGRELIARYMLRAMAITFAKDRDVFGDNIIPFYCKNCGYIELYKEMKEKKE